MVLMVGWLILGREEEEEEEEVENDQEGKRPHSTHHSSTTSSEDEYQEDSKTVRTFLYFNDIILNGWLEGEIHLNTWRVKEEEEGLGSSFFFKSNLSLWNI